MSPLLPLTQSDSLCRIAIINANEFVSFSSEKFRAKRLLRTSVKSGDEGDHFLCVVWVMDFEVRDLRRQVRCCGNRARLSEIRKLRVSRWLAIDSMNRSWMIAAGA
jgi:hypothetical protein